jgi:hypothetical protein
MIPSAVAFAWYRSGPRDNQRRGDATFVDPMFVLSERGVAHVGLCFAIRDVGIRISG